VQLFVRNDGDFPVTQDFTIEYTGTKLDLQTTVFSEDIPPHGTINGVLVSKNGFPIVDLTVKLDQRPAAGGPISDIDESDEDNNALCSDGTGGCRDLALQFWSNPDCP
jgi:hypothetical protein